MSPLDEQLEAVAAMLRAAGGIVGFDPNAPEFVKQAFLKMILECPECREARFPVHDFSVCRNRVRYTSRMGRQDGRVAGNSPEERPGSVEHGGG